MFNKDSRLKNIVLSSSFGFGEQILFYLLTFLYRTVFLMILTKEYLGISGLFTNILQIFSLTELGIGGVIAYRLYKPIKEEDVELCHALLYFYKKVYYVIALVVFLLGVILFPFLDFFIADANEIPNDINLSVIYWIYVLQSVFSYLFVYSQSLLLADQKNYIISFANSLYNITSTIIKIIVLILFKSYTFSLLIGVIANVIYNFIFAKVIKKKYRAVYKGSQRLNKQQKIDIFKDTGSLMCHKIGYVILNGTDSIILSKFIGFAVLGIYSNYSMIVIAIDTILNKVLGSFVSSVGNLSLDEDSKNIFETYKLLSFVNFWLVSLCTVCFCTLVNPFIMVWIGKKYLLKFSIVCILSLNLFFNSSGITNAVFINANGLFIKDKVRPIIQAVINLVISIWLVNKMGIAGIFIGTIVSNVLTTWWRQPIIVFENVFNNEYKHFFLEFFKWFILTVCICTLYEKIFRVMPDTFLFFVIKFLISVGMTNIIFLIIFRKNKYCLRCKRMVLRN